MDEMKILVIIPSMHLAGGIERVVSIQANYWADECHYDVTILVHSDDSCQSFFPLSDGVKIVYVGDRLASSLMDRIFKIGRLRKRISQFRRAIMHEAPDVVVSTMHGVENFFLRKCTGDIPIIGVNHVTLNMRRGDYLHSTLGTLLQRVKYNYQLSLYRNYDAIVALSKTDCQIFREKGCHAFYIPNPCQFHKVEEELSARRKKRVVMVGRMDYLKGYDRLLSIWKNLSKTHRDWQLVLVGDGKLYEKNLHLIERYGLKDCVEIIRKTKNVNAILSESSIFAFTSRSESFGMVILEALSCGLPVVTYDCENGPRDLIDNYYNGFLIPDDNEKLFTEKLSCLMEDESMRESMRNNAVQSCRRFSTPYVMRQWDDLLHLVTRS